MNDKVQLQKVETWFDPLEMFRQIAPKGVINKQVAEPATDCAPAMEEEQKPATDCASAVEEQKPATDCAPAVEEEQKPDLNGDMTPELGPKGTSYGERSVHSEDSGTLAARSAQSTASVERKHGTERELTSAEYPTVDHTTSNAFESDYQSTTSVTNQGANEDSRNALDEDILSSTTQATSPPSKHTINDPGHILDQPPETDSNPSISQSQTHNLPATLFDSQPSAVPAHEVQAQQSSFSTGACPFFTGPVPFGGVAPAATDDANQMKEETARNGMGEEELVDTVGMGAALASAEGSKETREAREEMGTIGQREREGMNKD